MINSVFLCRWLPRVIRSHLLWISSFIIFKLIQLFPRMSWVSWITRKNVLPLVNSLLKGVEKGCGNGNWSWNQHILWTFTRPSPKGGFNVLGQGSQHPLVFAHLRKCPCKNGTQFFKVSINWYYLQCNIFTHTALKIYMH